MRLICFWCFVLTVVEGLTDFYEPQTFTRKSGSLFTPIGHTVWPENTQNNQVGPGRRQPSVLFSPVVFGAPQNDPQKVDQWPSQPTSGSTWKARVHYSPRRTSQSHWIPPRSESWQELEAKSKPNLPLWENSIPPKHHKEKEASILHHKQSLNSDGSFRFEYASDNGLAAGESIEPDGSRVGAYRYQDPSGTLVTLKYRAGKEGFQILEGSHVPKSITPVAPSTGDSHNQAAYAQQKQQYELQQKYNMHKLTNPIPPADGKYFIQDVYLDPGNQDDGQYREKDGDVVMSNVPHSFGAGYEFSFRG